MFDLFEIDILYDVSAGCQRQCDDCVISMASPMANQRTEQFGKLLDEANDTFLLGNCWLGPTDIFASNQSISYTDAEVVKIASKFKSVILSTSLLGKDSEIENHARQVAAHYHVPIKLAIPVNLRLVDNIKYREHIWEKINLFEAALGRKLGTENRKVYFIGNLPTEEDVVDPDIFQKFKDDWGVQLDIAIGNGRQGIEQLRPVFDRSKNFFLNRISRENNFPASLLKEGRGIDLLFRNGDIYYLPFYNERIAVLDEKFRLLKQHDWTMDNLISDINELMVESLHASEKLTQCKSCTYNSRCSLFLLPIIQRRLFMDTCIQPKELMERNGTHNQAH
jgi:hypothetical protein